MVHALVSFIMDVFVPFTRAYMMVGAFTGSIGAAAFVGIMTGASSHLTGYIGLVGSIFVVGIGAVIGLIAGVYWIPIALTHFISVSLGRHMVQNNISSSATPVGQSDGVTKDRVVGANHKRRDACPSDDAPCDGTRTRPGH